MTHLWQAFGPWGPGRFPAYSYVAEDKYLPRDWDWAAATLNIRFPPLPYLAPAEQGGICDFLAYGLPILQRSVPNIAGVPEAGLGAMGNLTSVEPSPQAFSPEGDPEGGSRNPSQSPPVPKPSPPRYAPRGGDAGSATEGSAYESDWRKYWLARGWERNNSWNRKWEFSCVCGSRLEPKSKGMGCPILSAIFFSVSLRLFMQRATVGLWVLPLVAPPILVHPGATR